MMGGSGGGFFRGLESKDVNELFKQASSQTRNEAFEAEIAGRINELLVEYNERDVEKINAYLSQIRDLLSEDLESSIDLRFGGSIRKYTYINGFSDVDCLVFLRESALERMSPRQVLEYFQDKLRSRLAGDCKISIGNLAVTIEYPDDTKIQLLPAVRKESGYIIPESDGSTWSRIIHPEKFADLLTKVNQTCNGKLVPTIKLVKGIIATSFPGELQLTGYHVESLAIEIFRYYEGITTHKAMLERFFHRAIELVKKPIKDRTGQSIHVDDYLGDENSDMRQHMSDTFDLISRKLRNASGSSSVSEWLMAIGEEI